MGIIVKFLWIFLVFSQMSETLTDKPVTFEDSQSRLITVGKKIKPTYEPPPQKQAQGRTLGVIADLFLSAHCFVQDCKKSEKRADYCCSRNYNDVCCQFVRFTNNFYFGSQAYRPGAVAATLPVAFPQQPAVPVYSPPVPPVLPSAVGPAVSPIRRPLYPPIPPVTPSAVLLNPQLHHHFHEHSGIGRPFALDRPGLGPYPGIGIGGGGGTGLYKPGNCPARGLTTCYNCGDSAYLPPVGGIGGLGGIGGIGEFGLDFGRPTCNYDIDCPGVQKCCYVEMRRGSYTMMCRAPRGGGLLTPYRRPGLPYLP